jgi:hypothetical protein
MNYQNTRNTRREARTLVGRFRGGKLAPVMATAIRGNEGGMLDQNITLELDPIAGRMITPIMGEMMAVFVPVQAIDAIKDPNAAYPGMTEVIREKLLSGNPLFGLENEGEISKRCGVNPRSVGGAKRVNEMVRLAHNAAVNYLRQRKYDKATLLSAANTAVTPAIISQTVLDRLNGVLDPDDRINGAVQLDLPTMTLPVSGITQSSNIVGSGAPSAAMATNANNIQFAASGQPALVFNRNSGNPAGTDLDIFATLNGQTAGNVSLTDFYNAEKMDALTRTMRQIVDDNPEYGEEMVLRWAHGLNVDNAKVPFVIAEKAMMFGRSLVGATDTAGINGDVMRSDMMLEMSFSVPVPKTELGGIIITFACLKPDETLSGQPHPFLSDVWGAENFVADEMALDPVPVTIRELDADCTSAQETTVALYTGHNQLKATYVDYGLNRHLNPTTVANKTALWQIKVPMSVTPDSILYPENLDHYPFADQNAEVCTYTVGSQIVVQTPMIIGPTPVETLAVINSENLFEE